MPLLVESHDSLPYIDTQPSTDAMEAAKALLASEMDTESSQALHPSILLSYEPNFTHPMNLAHSKIAEKGTARSADEGIDLSRYEEPSVPTSEDRASWRNALRTAYVSQSYLSQRQINLSLLERFGKNAWLIGNSQVEEELRSLENELAEAKTKVEQVDEERRLRQERSRGELDGLEETWRATVSRAIEAEVASEVLRRRILEQKRGSSNHHTAR